MLIGLVSSGIVYHFGGPLDDILTLKVSRMRDTSEREPEFQLSNLFAPFLMPMIGCLIFGCSVQFHWHIAVPLLGNTKLMIASLTAATVLRTFIIESYPQWPGPVLVNINTLNIVISFGFLSHASSWIQEKGYLVVFGVYFAIRFFMLGLIPFFFFYGKKFRVWTLGRIPKDDGLDFQAGVGLAPKPGSSVGSTSGSDALLMEVQTLHAQPQLGVSTAR